MATVASVMTCELLQRSGTLGDPFTDLDVAQGLGPGSGRRFRCRACGSLITNDDEGLAIEGRYVHHRVNPAGIGFEFGCFRNAPGAEIAGRPTAEWSWFRGYTWVYALCRICTTHLGWLFQGHDPSFHALILDRLVAEGPADGDREN